MKANTAIGFLLASLCARLALAPPRARTRGVCALLALIVASNGAAVLIEYALRIDLGIDQLVFADPATAANAFPGRMSPATAVAFLAFGVALFALTQRKMTPFAHVLAITGGAIAGLRILGYTYGGQVRIGGEMMATMALPTTIAFCLLTIAILGARPDVGALRLLVAPGVGGRNVRRLMPTVLLLPALVGLVLGWGERAGLYDPSYHLALLVTLTTLLLSALIWKAGRAEEIGDRRREAFESLLKRSEARYRLLTEQSTDIIGRLRRDGTISYVSPAVRAIAGYDPDELVGRIAYDYLVHEDVDALRDTIEQARRSHGLETVCYRVRRHDGRLIWLETTLQAVPSSDEAGEGELACVSRDVTERKEIERLRADFLAMLSHDLKNPLGVVLGYVEMLEDRHDEATLRDALARIRASAATALRTTTNFIASTRIESGALQPRLEPRSLDGLVRDVVQQHESAARLGAVTLRTQLAKTPPIMLDEHLFAHVVDNLLSNAIKFSSVGGEVEIGTQAAGNDVELYIRDAGPGVPPEEQPRLFQRFESGRNAPRHSTGLGLFIARSIVEAHGGTIGYEAPAGGGSTFRVRLPRATDRPQYRHTVSTASSPEERLH